MTKEHIDFHPNPLDTDDYGVTAPCHDCNGCGVAKEPQPAAQSERQQMTDAEKTAAWEIATKERNRLSRMSFFDGIESAEAFHGIKK